MSTEPTSPAEPLSSNRRRLRWLGMAVLCSMTVAWAMATASTLDWPATPDPLPWELEHLAPEHVASLGRVDVYNCWGNLLDSQYLWRVEAGPEMAEAFVSGHGLIKWTPKQVPPQFWQKFPYWWRPPRTRPARFFVSPGFCPDQRGRDGDFYLMCTDGAAGILYVWHKSNF